MKCLKEFLNFTCKFIHVGNKCISFKLSALLCWFNILLLKIQRHKRDFLLKLNIKKNLNYFITFFSSTVQRLQRYNKVCMLNNKKFMIDAKCIMFMIDTNCVIFIDDSNQSNITSFLTQKYFNEYVIVLIKSFD